MASQILTIISGIALTAAVLLLARIIQGKEKRSAERFGPMLVSLFSIATFATYLNLGNCERFDATMSLMAYSFVAMFGFSVFNLVRFRPH